MNGNLQEKYNKLLNILRSTGALLWPSAAAWIVPFWYMPRTKRWEKNFWQLP